jgi:hypothetical protein
MKHQISDRKFGIGLSAICFVVGGFLWLKSGSFSVWLFGIGFAMGVCAVGIPQVFIPLNCLFMALSEKVSVFMNHLILGVIFFLVITPVFVIARIFKWDPMGRVVKKQQSTYWQKSCGKITAKQFIDQF